MHFGFFFSFSIILADARSMIANNRSLTCLTVGSSKLHHRAQTSRLPISFLRVIE